MKKIYFMFLIMFFAGLRIGYGQDDIVVDNDQGICGAAVTFSLPEPGQISLEPIADSYVSNLNATTNFGTSDRLNVDPTEYGGSRIDYTYLKFDVTSLPPGATITGVKLQMQSWGGYAYGGDGNVYNLFVADDSWTETGIIWNNAPAATTNLGFWWQWCNNFSSCNATVINADPALTNQVVTELAGDGTISIRLHSPGYVTYYRSREYGTVSQRPKLIIDYNYAVTQTAGLSSGSIFPKGTTTNTFVATDVAGNSATFNFDVTVNDTEAPTVNDPSDITVNNDVDLCGAVVCYPAPVASDNCRPATPAGYNFLASFGNSYYYQSNVLSNYATAEANAAAAGGLLAVITSAAENAAIAAGGGTFSFIGGNDLANEGTFTWSNCETYSYFNFGGGEPNGGTGENYLEFMGGGFWNDIGGNNPRYAILEIEGASIVQTAGLPANSVFPFGTTTNTFVITDAAGNTATCSFDVTVIDNQAPAINCSSDIDVDNDPGVCGAVVTYPMPSVIDNCTFPSSTIAGFTTLGVFDGNTFYISNALFTGPNAFNDAVANGGFLASINSEQENTFIRNAANSVAGAINILIGFNDVGTEGTFVWQNGDPVSYTNWNGGEPNDAGGEDYTEILPSGKWNGCPRLLLYLSLRSGVKGKFGANSRTSFRFSISGRNNH